MPFQFPFSTCENSSSTPPIQPASFYANCIAVLILVGFLVYAIFSTSITKKNRTYIFTLFLSFVLFESWHAFSHYYHIDAKMNQNQNQNQNLQAYVAHALFYFIILSTLFTMCHLGSGKMFNGNIYVTCLFLLLIVVDLYMVIKWKGLFMMFSGFSLLLFVYYTHFHLIPKSLKKYLYIMLILLFILIALVSNEAFFCEQMQKNHAFPYHVLVEVMGAIIFSVLSYFYFVWSSKK